MVELGLSRRGFLATAFAASVAKAIEAKAGVLAKGGKPNIMFGVLSDLHITTPESTAAFRRALVYFRDRGVDAVVVAGDLSDWGLKSGLKCVADAWYDVFPNDRAPDGRKVEKLFCTGNHDYDGYWYGDMTLDMHVQGYSEEESLVKLGMKKCWEEVFHEPFEQIRRRTVKGYDFISSEWKDGADGFKEADAWFAANGASLDPKKPFFVFTHYPFANTTSGSGGNAYSGDTLRKYPNAVSFSGHVHWTLNDEQSIWQKEYTAITVPSMSYTTIPWGRENGGAKRNGKCSMSMQCLPAREFHLEAQGYLVSVFDDRMEVERRDFTEGEEAAPPWIVTPPAGDASRYAHANSRKRTPVPQFPDGASVKTYTSNFETRSFNWTIMMMLEFPSARARGGRVFDYEVRAEMEDGTVAAKKCFLAPAFYRLERDEPKSQRFAFDAMDLPERGKYRLRVYPRNCFGDCGKPIESAVLESKPGKAKSPVWKEG
ncbi:MAG: metallophosphoesterase [Kiritimatiellae bacterium]|nr:metallophosphoesterase [Kiritimatiellia bacterium]